MTERENKTVNRDMLLGITDIRTVTRTGIKLLIVYINHSLPGSLLLLSVFFVAIEFSMI